MQHDNLCSKTSAWRAFSSTVGLLQKFSLVHIHRTNVGNAKSSSIGHRHMQMATWFSARWSIQFLGLLLWLYSPLHKSPKGGPQPGRAFVSFWTKDQQKFWCIVIYLFSITCHFWGHFDDSFEWFRNCAKSARALWKTLRNLEVSFDIKHFSKNLIQQTKVSKMRSNTAQWIRALSLPNQQVRYLFYALSPAHHL